MQNKYLPIGSIVTINDSNKKIMIIGYYSIKYMNVVKMYDYLGCVYPEGMLLPNDLYSFNHSDIVSIAFTGFKDDSYEVLNENLNSPKPAEDLEKNSNFVNVKYDKNGVVVYDEVPEIKVDSDIMELLDSVDIKNPFTVPAESKEVKSRLLVVGNDESDDAEKALDQPESLEQENSSQTIDTESKNVKNATSKEETSNEEYSIPHYRFDENGIIISE